MSTPLRDALQAHLQKNRAPFHTPGHKGHPPAVFDFDLTELPDTDSLFEADGPILQAEQQAARLFHSRRTLFSAGGCTLCMQAMLRLALPQGGKLLAGRVIHRSAVHTMALLDITPVWLLPQPDAGTGLAGRIDPRDVEAALSANPQIRAVYLTCPDYFGVLSDLRAISQVAHAHHVPLLVDNAHGAHLGLLPQDLHPLTFGADLCACSAHKTLPVLTGGAFLNIGDTPLAREYRYAERAKQAMALFGSTSPNYMVMASLDDAVDWALREGKAAFSDLLIRMQPLRQLCRQKHLPMPRGPHDESRLSFCSLSAGLTGEQAAAHLRQHGVEPEYADNGWVVCILTPQNTPQDLSALYRAIASLPDGDPDFEKHPSVFPVLPSLPETVLTPRQALLRESKPVPLSQAVGHIAAGSACPCPPGVPVVMPGERITKNLTEFLYSYGFSFIEVVQ